MDQAVLIDSRFSRVRSFTTRRPRANDEPGQYIYLTPDQLIRERSHDTIVSETTFPTTGQSYGTLFSSYTGEYCLLDTLANSVDTYRALPFHSTQTISLAAEAEQWRQWFVERFPDSESYDAAKRLEEAVLSIEWSLNDPDTIWLVNGEAPEVVADKLVKLSLGEAEPDTHGADLVRGVLELIKSGDIWR